MGEEGPRDEDGHPEETPEVQRYQESCLRLHPEMELWNPYRTLSPHPPSLPLSEAPYLQLCIFHLVASCLGKVARPDFHLSGSSTFRVGIYIPILQGFPNQAVSLTLSEWLTVDTPFPS